MADVIDLHRGKDGVFRARGEGHRSRSKTALWVTGLLLLGGGAAALAAMAGGKKLPQPGPKVDPLPADPVPAPVDPIPADPVEPAPEPAPKDVPAGSLAFDLSTNWGGIPMSLRVWLARAELASGIPGIARALAVKWWQAFRAKQAPVSVDEAAAIAAANPELCRKCRNLGDAGASKANLDNGIAQGWPKPVDYNGWAAASYGLGDILGGVAVFAGIHTDKGGLPDFIKAKDAYAFMQTYEAQIMAAAYAVRRILLSTKYKVLVPGANSNAGDSWETWGNIFAAYAYPDSYSKGEQLAMNAKQRYLARSLEIGIDLKQVAYPWPPGVSYKSPPWKASTVWAKIKDFAKRDVVDGQGGGGDPAPEAEEDQNDDYYSEVEVADLPGAKIVSGAGVGPDIPAPLVIVLHGADADENQLQTTVDLGLPVRYAFLRAPNPGKTGFRWYAGNNTTPDAELEPQIRKAADWVVSATKKLTAAKFPVTKLFVVGYSQGGSVAYDLAAKPAGWWTAIGADPKMIGGALIIAGFLPAALRPKAEVPGALYAVHGKMDKAISFSKGEAAYESFIFKAFTKNLWVEDGDHGLNSLRPAAKQMLAEMIKS